MKFLSYSLIKVKDFGLKVTKYLNVKLNKFN